MTTSGLDQLRFLDYWLRQQGPIGSIVHSFGRGDRSVVTEGGSEGLKSSVLAAIEALAPGDRANVPGAAVDWLGFVELGFQLGIFTPHEVRGAISTDAVDLLCDAPACMSLLPEGGLSFLGALVAAHMNGKPIAVGKMPATVDQDGRYETWQAVWMSYWCILREGWIDELVRFSRKSLDDSWREVRKHLQSGDMDRIADVERADEIVTAWEAGIRFARWATRANYVAIDAGPIGQAVADAILGHRIESQSGVIRTAMEALSAWATERSNRDGENAEPPVFPGDEWKVTARRTRERVATADDWDGFGSSWQAFLRVSFSAGTMMRYALRELEGLTG